MTFIRTGLITGCAVLGLVIGCADDVPPTAPVLRNITVPLTPSEETPAVTASSSGTANLIISDTNEVSVQLIVANIDSVTAAHIHAGSPGVAGPIMVNLTPTYALSALKPDCCSARRSDVSIAAAVLLTSTIVPRRSP